MRFIDRRLEESHSEFDSSAPIDALRFPTGSLRLSVSLLFALPTAFPEQHCTTATIPKNKKGDLDLTALTMDTVHLNLLIEPPPTPGLRRDEPE